MIRLENRENGHNKFYEVYYSYGRVVTIRYGAIGTAGTTVRKTFGSTDEAWSWQFNQKNAKMSAGYSIASHDSDSSSWRSRAVKAEKKLESIRSEVA